MPARHLLDTVICIYLRSNDRPVITQRFRALDRDKAAVFCHLVRRIRLWCCEKQRSGTCAKGIEWLSHTVQLLPLPTDAAQIYGEIRAGLFGSGCLIGPSDLWIAAHALAGNLTLVTNNECELRRIRGLKIENWAW